MRKRGREELEHLLEKVLVLDSRYKLEAYAFILESLDFSVRKLKEPRHLTALELLDGIRKFAIKSFGPMSKTVLEDWGLKTCEDFGEIVFHLVRCGIISKTQEDTEEDFKKGYDFEEAFEKPFLV
ncbi:MAG: hypothetical protein HYS07_08830 [Chlamydiae bacterium]|nr:hypothetical protein [Chlamydiota bacterium]MBI3277002.1 hypothetical protein [Chlamydiota bacterium]